MEKIVIAIILIAGGLAGIFYLRPKILGTLLEIQFLKTTGISEVLSIFAQMRDSGMSDDYRQYVELKGTAATEAPVITPFSDQNVAYYDAKLLHITERRERYRDKNNVMQERVHKQEDLISNEKSSETVFLKDNSCAEKVILEIGATGLKLDIPVTFDRFENKNNLSRYRYFNAFSRSSDASSLGYKMVEKTIRQNQPLYVIGEAFQNGGAITIGKPMDSKKPFLITTKSEEDLVNTAKRNAALALYGGIAAAVLGVGVLIYSFM